MKRLFRLDWLGVEFIVATLALLLFGVATAFAAWDSTKPAQTQTVSAGMSSAQGNFAAVEATGSGQAVIGGTNAGTFEFEGATADAFETTLTITDPTADRTITFPDSDVLVEDDGISLEGATDDGFETKLAITDPTADRTFTLPDGDITIAATTTGTRTVTLPDSNVSFAATAPGLTLGTANAAGSATTFLRTDATVALFNDGATPEDLGTAATGTDAYAARRDHVHNPQNFELGRTTDDISGNDNSTDVSITLDVESRVLVIMTGEITTGGNATQFNIRRDTVTKDSTANAARTVGTGLCLQWTETLAADSYAFDVSSTGDNSVHLDVQLVVIAVPNT